MKLFLKIILLKPLFNLLILLVFLMPKNNLGMAVIILTILIRLAILPLTKTITRQQALMQKLKPEMDKLKVEYKDNQQEMAKATMEFYKKHNISPFGSCLPMIVQLVILIVLYYVFRIGVTTERFDLLYSFTPRPDSINPNFLGIDLSKPDLWVLPIITGVLQFIQTWQMLPKGKISKDDPAGAMQKNMVYFFPIFTVMIARGFPAALPLYWSVSSIVSIIQQKSVLAQTDKINVREADKLLESGANIDEVVNIESTKQEIEKSTKKGVEITVRKRK